MFSSCRDWRTFRTSGVALGIVVGMAIVSSCEPDLDSLTAGNGASGSGGSGNEPGAGMGGRDPLGGTGGMGAMGGTGGTPIPTPQCMDGRRGAGESDVDCGGSSTCERCEVGKSCTENGDCELGFCYRKKCEEPTCDDGIQNQDETDLDCGGVCSPCEEGLACNINPDCATEYCSPENVCVSHCESGRVESDETDTDCGGSTCGPCPDEAKCKLDTDCQDGLCADGVCLPQSCMDNRQNQGETDVDCGGACAQTQPCPVGKGCDVASDCTSYICTDDTCQADLVIPEDDVIDDMEDINNVILPRGGRVGSWYPYGDGKGTTSKAGLDEIPGRRGPSQWAMHTAGMGFSQWGSGIGLDLNNSGGKKVYDASQYSGITFWARAESDIPLKVVVPELRTTPGFGYCTPPAAQGEPDGCDHHFVTSITLTTEWRRHNVCFSSFVQESGAIPLADDPPNLDNANLVSIQFRMDPNTVYDYWIDDIAFLAECEQ